MLEVAGFRVRAPLALVGPRRDAVSGWAIAAMLWDHLVCVLAHPVAAWWYVALRVPGRFAMPAFACLVASALLRAPDGGARFSWRLFWLGLVSELPYRAFFGEPVNAIAALCAGAFVVRLVRRGAWVRAVLLVLAFGGVCLSLGQGAELAYALLVASAAWLVARGGVPALLAAFWCCSLVNGGEVYAVATCAAFVLVLWGPVPLVPTLSQRARQWFYPVHLAALSLLVHLGA